MKLTYQEFVQLFPLANKPKATYEGLSKAMEAYMINTPLREAMFLGQVAHESGGFKWIRELGGIAYFKRYEGRKDLGNTQAGDGYKYRGRGYIQLTGRFNYTKYGNQLHIDLVNNPELAVQPEIAATIAAEYWTINGLNSLADQNMIKTITKRINGGYNGLQDRINNTNKILAMIQNR